MRGAVPVSNDLAQLVHAQQAHEGTLVYELKQQTCVEAVSQCTAEELLDISNGRIKLGVKNSPEASKQMKDLIAMKLKGVMAETEGSGDVAEEKKMAVKGHEAEKPSLTRGAPARQQKQGKRMKEVY